MSELTVDDQILTWLRFWGVETPIKIEDEMKDAILTVLSSENTVCVYVDKDGGLVVEGDE